MKKRKWSMAILACILFILLSSSSVLAADDEVTIKGGTNRDNAPDVSYGTNYVDSLTETRQTNWYKLTTTGKEGYYIVWMKNYGIDSKITATIYKGTSWDPLLTVDNKKTKEDKAGIKLSVNSVYYIRISNAVTTTTGKYGFNVSFNEDKSPDQQKDALESGDGQTIEGSIDAGQDVDWYKFVAPASGSYKIRFNKAAFSKSTMYGNVYDEVGTQVCDNFFLDYSSSYELKSGETYYIWIIIGFDAGDYPCHYKLQFLNETKLTGMTLNRAGTVKVKRGKTLAADVKSVAPANASKAVTWRSSAPRIAAVDANGQIKGIGMGTVTITATSFVTEKITASFKVSVIPETPVITEVKSVKTKTAVLTWNKIVGTKFEIYRAESKNGKYTRIKTVAAGKTTYTDKTVKAKKTYYYKIVAYATNGSTRYASAYSKAVSVKTK